MKQRSTPPPVVRRVKRHIRKETDLIPTTNDDDDDDWLMGLETMLPRINAVALMFLWVIVLFSWRSSGGGGGGGNIIVEHDLQHVREAIQAQSHRQIKFNIHPQENGQVLRHPPHARDFIAELDMYSLQDYRLCCTWADKFICDEQRVRAEVQSTDGDGGKPFLKITAFIGKVDAHCVFSWTAQIVGTG